MRAIKSLLWTISFLTIIPAGKSSRGAPPSAGWIAFWFPLVGLGLGLLGAGVSYGSLYLFRSIELCSLAVVAFFIVITRGLHVDGLADTFDGLLGAPERDKRLAIMRDSRIGVFGVTAIVLVIAAKITGLNMLYAAPWVIGPMPMVGRWAMLFGAATSGYARDGEGTGKLLIGSMKPAHFCAAGLLPLAVLVFSFGLGGVIMAGVAMAAALLLTVAFRTMIGGATGDTLGATGELVETAYLLTFVALVVHWPAFLASPLGRIL
jgi:adenosylcobinamide-GDP ribazoletransferase